jgi:hypothetical protein
MTIETIRTKLNGDLDGFAGTYGETNILTQVQLTAITDLLATELETINPNGPGYPSTPK